MVICVKLRHVPLSVSFLFLPLFKLMTLNYIISLCRHSVCGMDLFFKFPFRWSYGVVLFELITLGGTPYPTIPNKDLLKELQSGYRMEKPDTCPTEW